MLTFSNWTDEIAEVSTLREFQNADVTLVDRSLLTYGEFNPLTNKRPVSGDPDVWTGQARIIGVRDGVNRVNAESGNSMTISSLRVQLPKKAVGRMKRGIQLRVEACEDNPTLESRVFTLTSDFQGSNTAAQTFEFALDGDAITPEAD